MYYIKVENKQKFKILIRKLCILQCGKFIQNKVKIVGQREWSVNIGI